MCILRGRRTFCCKGELEMVDDFVYDRMIFDEGDHSHLTTTMRAEQSIIEARDPVESSNIENTSREKNFAIRSSEKRENLWKCPSGSSPPSVVRKCRCG